MERISATHASRHFSEILNRARYGGESFLVERGGEPVAEIRPVPRRSTGADLVRFLRENPMPDEDFAEDVRTIIAERDRDIPRDPWNDS